MDSDSELLGLLDSDSKILIPGNENRVADRSVPSEWDHISDNQGVHPLLLADAVDEAEPDLDVLQVSEREMLRRRARGCPVVPIHSKKWYPGDSCGEIAQGIDSLVMGEADVRSREFPSCEEHGALREHVPRIYEDGDPIHDLQKEKA